MDVSQVRQDFPVLDQDLIYLDSACMSLRPEPVMEKVEEYYREFPACSGRSHHSLGERASEEVEKSRERVAEFIGADPQEIVFVRNTTEAINLVANSLGLSGTVITSDREHNSNLVPWQGLGEVEHRIVGSEEERFDLEEFREEMDEEVELVSIVHTSNLDGYTLPVEQIIDTAHEYNALVLVDGAQSAPHRPVDVNSLDADFFAFSGHKMLGPSGIGALYVREELYDRLDPFIVGG
ncbi:MAG: aminotransferase class V-fold PLP-dependent enzyme, partial [Candidatus Nanohaloarchaea archaeon]|nr:aminotransferase class V-fold PLP-dependent enzyme [Candidatus Nanohaloarchaea archaeon]